ncbi:hypothetical protein [Jiulongibacter sp. NS-SX5]|uniref:hypothetical protein n=1 Tax=Jiulongibacter sp. NS-SX5 TaxID=3463854 RepID=UPI004058EE52
MTYWLTTIFLFYLSTLGFSQDNLRQVLSAENRDIIPFASITNLSKNRAYTADSQGTFNPFGSVAGDTLLISSVGFYSHQFTLGKNKEFTLKPKLSILNEVTVNPPQWRRTKAFSKLKRKQINGYLGNNYGSHNWQSARKIEPNEDFKNLCYLKSVSFLTISQKSNIKFEVIIYSIDENGQPGNYLHHEKIFGIADKGKRVTSVNLKPFNIKIPPEGVFVAVQWLLVDQNVNEYTIYDKNGTRLGSKEYYEPSFGSERGEGSIGYRKGGMDWEKLSHSDSEGTLTDYPKNVIVLEFEISD